jgi:hypothetical protein
MYLLVPQTAVNRAKMEISVWAIIVTETDSPTSRTCQMGFRIVEQRSASARAWAAARTASKMAQATVFSLFGGTSISIAGPAPSGAAISERGRGAGRHVRVPCPVECPHACSRPRGPAPPPPLLCRGRTLVTRHPRSSSARRVASAGVGRRRRPRRSGGAATDPRPQGCGIPLRDGRWQRTKHVCVLAPHVFKWESRFTCARTALLKFELR